MNRRIFMKFFGTAAIAGAAGLMYCGMEPYWLQRIKRQVSLKGRPLKRIRILHVSDLHIGNRQQLEFIEKSLMDGLAQNPDLICMTGDFINRKLFNARGCRALFSRLSSSAPVFACLGNHDGGEWAERVGGYADPTPVADLLSESGVRVLRNENITLQVNGQSLSLVGVDDLWSGTLDIKKAFGRAAGSGATPRVILSHNPDTKSALRKQKWDLMLCGHTHGGQVSIPGVGAPLLPVKDRRFTRGLYQWDNRQIHISSGVGTAHGVRFNCPPEICHLELKGTS